MLCKQSILHILWGSNLVYSKSLNPTGVKIQYPSEILRNGKANRLVWKHQPLELWKRGRKHYAA
jgi:hypothetical protein